MTDTPRHFIDLSDFSSHTIRSILNAAADIKLRRAEGKRGSDRSLENKVIAMVFEQPSLRTRVSFDVGIRELGGQPIMLTGSEIELGQREALKDTAGVLSRYVDGMMVRMLKHDALRELAQHSRVPVINGLTKTSHPCQVMADILTFEEKKGAINGHTVAWVGDSNNVLASWVHAAARLDVTLNIATPKELAPPAALLEWARKEGAKLNLTNSAAEAVTGADTIITDTWVSMGDTEGERYKLLEPFQVNAALMRQANKDALFMHCLPAHRGEEVTDEVIDGPQSVVLDEAENRLHAQKGIMAWCFGAVA